MTFQKTESSVSNCYGAYQAPEDGHFSKKVEHQGDFFETF